MFDITRSSDSATSVLSGARPEKVNDTHSLSIRAHKSIVAKTIAARFVTARELNGFSQTDASAKLGYKKSGQLSQIESGKKQPPMALLVRAAEVYRVSTDYLLGVSDEPDRDPKLAVRLHVLKAWESILGDAAQKLCDSAITATKNMGDNWQVAQAYLDEGERLLSAFRAFQRLNAEAFDDMRGGAALISAAERFEHALGESRFQITRTHRVMGLTVKQVADPARLAQNMDLFAAGQA